MAGGAAAAAARGLFEVFRGLQARLKQVPASGLTPSQSAVLLRLYKEGASSTTLLALAEGVRSQSMTATLHGLDELGLIERSGDPQDGRRHVITLSPAGRRRGQQERAGREAWLAGELDRRFTAEQLATINEALGLLGGLNT